METEKKRIGRRALISSMTAVGIGAAYSGTAFADPGLLELNSPAIPVRVLDRVYMVAGASAGARLLAGGAHGLIIYSDDAGKTWHQAKVPVSVTITDIAFATPQIGWATGSFGVVLGTKDGGLTWVKQLDGNAAITLMNNALASFTASQPPGSDAVDHATRRAHILTEQGPDKPMLCLLPISATEVFAFGTYRTAEHSTDGGTSWVDWNANIGDPTSHNIYGAAAIGGAYYLVGETSLIFRSTDGGKTFPQLAQPGQATFYGICDAGGGNILAYGVAGEMYLSSDGGKTWNAPNFTGTQNVNSVIQLGPMLLAGDAGGGVWYSLDHGQNFKLAFRNPLVAVNALQPISGLRFLIMSDIGVIPIDLSAMHG